MEFGIGFVSGGLLSGVAVMNSKRLVAGWQQLSTRMVTAAKQKIAAVKASLKAKL